MNGTPTFRGAIRLKEGPRRTAALAAWIQGLFIEHTPVLVGGAAVELYTGGAHTTGDLDFIGQVPPSVSSALRREGFRKEGRHWIHEEQEIFIEFPGSSVAVGEKTATILVGGISVLTLSPEDMIVDRLSAWQFWGSATDGVSAYLLWKAQKKRLDNRRLTSIAGDRGVARALNALRKLVRGGQSASASALEQWANQESET